MPAPRSTPYLALAAALLAAPVAAGAQQGGRTPAPAPATADSSVVLNVGDVAPDFALPAATRYGLLQDSVRLSDFKGKTVVLAFFFKARTKG